jgi:hypothetical protein
MSCSIMALGRLQHIKNGQGRRKQTLESTKKAKEPRHPQDPRNMKTAADEKKMPSHRQAPQPSQNTQSRKSMSASCTTPAAPLSRCLQYCCTGPNSFHQKVHVQAGLRHDITSSALSKTTNHRSDGHSGSGKGRCHK